ncbi:proline-rich protein 2-like [Schistocerca nitens]|uniref:proline-rich protein 2-like n=1 Tax=Schistocerca nitens TaxID=7011 RepID=UPI0021187694|nr:proline-rich protein 2-like [Schistocerca nitens]
MDIHVLQSQPAQKVAFKDSSTVRVGNKLVRNKPPTQPSAMRPKHLVSGGFQPRLPTSLPPPGQQQQPSPLPRRQPVPLMPPAQLHTGAPRVVAPAPEVPLQSPPPSELMDVDPAAGPPSQAVAVQPVLQPLSLGTPKESDTAAPCPAPTQQPSPQRQETLPLFVGPDAPSRPVPEAAPVVTGVHPDLGFQSVFPEAPRSQCWGADRGLPPTTVSAPNDACGSDNALAN